MRAGLACAAGGLVGTTALAQWQVLQQVPPGQPAGWQATVLQQARHGARPPAEGAEATVGQFGRAANPSARQLRISQRSAPGAGARLLQVLNLPSETVPGDPCNVVDLADLQVQGREVTLVLDFQFACGAGGAVQASYVLRQQGARLVLTRFTLASSFREGSSTTQVDYARRRIAHTSDRPEDEQPAPPSWRPLAWGPQPLGPKGLLRCPKPFRPGPVPGCRSEILPASR